MAKTAQTNDRQFDQLWAEYPRRVAKEAALRAWRRLPMTPQLFVNIVAAVTWQREQVSWTKEGGAYVPHLATWLNGRRWLDERPSVPRMNYGSCCTHDPMCRSTSACIELTLAEARAERVSA